MADKCVKEFDMCQYKRDNVQFEGKSKGLKNNLSSGTISSRSPSYGYTLFIRITTSTNT